MSSSSLALAQPSATDRAAAESLFLDGRKLLQEGKVAEACRKLEESNRLDPAPGTVLNMAVCHEQEGKLATAWGEFRQSLAIAKREGRAEREKLATEHIAAIEARLPKIVVQVPPAAKVKGLVIKRNGSPFGEGAWNTPIPADPGEELVEAEAPGFMPHQQKVKLLEGKTLTVVIPQLTPKPEEPPPPPPPEAKPNKTMRIASYALMGVGAVGIGLGSVFGVRALSKKSDSDKECPNDQCTAAGVSLNNDAKSAARIANVGIGVGLVAVGAGVYLFIASSPSKSDQSEAPTGRGISLSVSPLPAGGVASMGGSF